MPDRQIKILSAVFNPANVVKDTAVEQAVTVTGVEVGDVVIVNKPTVDAGVGVIGCRVTAQNTVGLVFANFTGAAGADVNPGSETYLFAVMRP
jgi:hypothetical protein